MYFDGKFSNHANINVSIKGEPIYHDPKTHNDTYYYPDPEDITIHPPGSSICYTNDCLFTWSPNEGLKFRHQEDLEHYIK